MVVQAASIDTNHESRDRDLRGSDFFEVERFPGELTVRDVTREVRIPFEVSGPINAGQGRRRLGVEGAFRINRHEYGLRWNRVIEAGPVVADEVRIELSIAAVSSASQ